MSRWSVRSPNGELILKFRLSAEQADEGVPSYSVTYRESPLLLESRLGLELAEGLPLAGGFQVLEAVTGSVDQQWRSVFGERDWIPERYNSLTMKLQDGQGRLLDMEFRLYDEGLAFRYVIPEQQALTSFVIQAERSQFHFPQGCLAYEEHGAEGEYHCIPVCEIKPNCERPLTVVYPEGTCVSLTEAALYDYSRMLLSVNPDHPWIVESTLSGLISEFVGYGFMDDSLPEEETNALVKGSAPFTAPWRVLIVGDRPGDLLERNYLVLNLNEPCALEVDEWSCITPGKVLRDMILSPSSSKACIDFAAEHGIEYVSLEEGWYGNWFDETMDCTKPENRAYFHSKSGEVTDVREVVRYAESKGIKILVYLDRRAIEQQIDIFLPLYKEWGIKAIKFGFVNTGPQKWTKWLLDCVRKCAEYGMAVNIHDAYRPTGFSRTYPNLLTQEGIRGNEHMPTARHNATVPFTRYIAGAGDYTICYYTERLQTTHAHQLAMAVIAYSPLQSVLWYDKPSSYEGEPEIAFFNGLPTVWNETRVPLGSIGEYAVLARRKGEEWFIGAITNEAARELEIELDFLESNRSYIATIYRDDLHNQVSRTKVAITTLEVNAETVLRAAMAPSGGQAIRIRPKGLRQGTIQEDRR